MKILQVVPYFPPAYAFGGPVKVVHQASRELMKRMHEVVVWTSDAKDFDSRLGVGSDEAVDGVRVYYFRNLALMLVKKFKLFVTPLLVFHSRKEIKMFDVVHLHEYRTFQNIVAAYYARKYGVPYILQAHGSLPRIMARQRLKWVYDILFGYRLLRNASKVIALSRMEAKQYKAMGVPEKKIAVIPNGIDLSEYTDLPPEGSFKKKLGIDADEKIVLYLGRVHRLKGIDFLVRSFAYLINNATENSKLVIAGPDDGYLDEVKFLVNSLGISDLVLFTGILPEEDKISAYVDSSICTYLSPFEPFGIVTLEAVACGTPVIVSRGTYMARVVDERKFGFSVKCNAIYELAETMRKVLNDNDLLREMGQKGRKFVFENFNWTEIVVKLEKVYEDVVKRNQ